MRNQRSKNPVLQSQCGDLTIRKTRRDMVKTYEGMAYQAERDKDHILAHTYWQQAEHFKKELPNERIN